LGDAGVNIGNFALARGGTESVAVGVLTVDSPIAEDVVAEIRRIPAVRDARVIVLW
jgi:hypothetical protein